MRAGQSPSFPACPMEKPGLSEQVGLFLFGLCALVASLANGWLQLSVETTRGMGEHGVDLAGVRGEIGLRHHVVAIVARDIG